MESFKIVIDGKECEAFPGETVLEVAQRNGITIPVFCYHKELRPEGACRVCLVEVEGAPRLATACTLKAMPNMVVKTDTERVRKARAGVVELILNNHTLECPICDKAGECELQMTGFRFGPKKSRYKEPRREKNKLIQGPLIEINNDRCILCRRCIRMCGENMGNRVLGIFNRGCNAYISPFNGDFVESGCEHCGSCVDVCPVGSLLDRAFKYKDRPWRMDKTWTTCSFCGSGCRVEVDSYHGKVKRVVGRIGINEGHNRGYLCVRGKWGWDSIYSDRRLDSPLLRDGENLKKISLEEAVEILKEKINGKKVNLFIESSLTNEELESVAAVFGTENVTADSYGYYTLLKGISSVSGKFGTDPISSIYKTDVILYVGDFLEDTNPVISTLLRLSVIQNGKRLIRIGTFPSKLDSVAFSSIRVPQEKMIDVLKHFIVGTMNRDYSSGDEQIDSAVKSVRGKSVCIVVGGNVSFSVDAQEIGKTVAYLSDMFPMSFVVAVPPKANSLKVAELFDLKLPHELNGEVNVIVNASTSRDFPGVQVDSSKFTVVFTPFYTHDVSYADLVIPIETWIEKKGTLNGVEGKLELNTVLNSKYSLREILLQLPVSETNGKVKEEISVKKEPGESKIEREEGKLLLTVQINRTGWNSVSYYSSNVSKVAGRRELLLNPKDAPDGEMAVLKTSRGELVVPVKVSGEIPEGHALLREEDLSPEVSGLVEFPFLSGIKCEIRRA
jgi:NADH-quinone oxidoreductase subunit G